MSSSSDQQNKKDPQNETQEQDENSNKDENTEIQDLQNELKALKFKIESHNVAPKKSFSNQVLIFVFLGVACAVLAHLTGEYHPKIVQLEKRNLNLTQDVKSLSHKVRLLRYMPQYGHLDRMDLGIERFFKDGDVHLYGTYEQWYRNLTSWMKNRKTYRAENYMLVRKQFSRRHTELFVSNENQRDAFGESHNAFTVDGFAGDEMRKSSKVMVLHPESETKYVNFINIDGDSYYNMWMANSVSSDNYYGSKKSAIVLVLMK